MNAACMMMKIPDEFAIDSNATMKIAAWRGLSEFCMMLKSHLPDGRCQGLFDRPAIFKAHTDRSGPDIQVFGPLSQRHGILIKCHDDVVAPVILLLLHGCPTAISKAVTFIVINSIDAVLRCRPIPHIGIEVLKTLPSFANGDPASLIIRMPSPLAPLHHAHPGRVDEGAFLTVGCMGNFSYRTCNFTRQASARSRLSFSQGLPGSNRFLAAVTNAIPAWIAMIGKWSTAYNRKPAETFSCEIDEFHMGDYKQQTILTQGASYGI